MQRLKRLHKMISKMKKFRKIKYYRWLIQHMMKEGIFVKEISYAYLKNLNEYNFIQQFMVYYFITLDQIYDSKENEGEKLSVIIDFTPAMIKYMYASPDMQVIHVEIYFKKLETIYRRYGLSSRRIEQEKFKYYINLGLWEKSFKSFTKWMDEKRDRASGSDASEEADRAYYYYLIGDNGTGEQIFETIDKGILTEKNLKLETTPRLYRYMLEEGKLELALEKAFAIYNLTKRKEKYLAINAEAIKIVYLYNEKIAYDMWRKEHWNFLITENEYDRFQFGVATFLIFRNFTKIRKNSKIMIEMKRIVEEMYKIQVKYDKKNKNNHFIEEIMFWEKIQNGLENQKKIN